MEQYFKTRASIDDDPDLARNRRANDARLKSRFEHIFAKYGKDFDGVGDEIDLETGRIIVNNGHIERMQHEVDPGQSGSSQVLQVLGQSLQDGNEGLVHGDGFVIEDSVEDSEDDEGLGITGTSGYSSSDLVDEEEQHKTGVGAPDELSSDYYPVQDGTPERAPPSAAAALPVRESDGRRQANNDQAVTRVHATSRNISPNDQPVDLPFLRESMEAMQVPPGQHGSIDPNVIQALGQSIANQLAIYMTGTPKKSRKKSPDQRGSKDSRWEYPMLPGDRVDRTPTPPLPTSASAALFATSPDREGSIWAPQRRYNRRKSNLQSQVFNSTAVGDEDDGEIDPLQSDPPSFTATNTGDEVEGAADIDCYNCGITNSRVWRVCSDGRLCDPCGTYYRRYGLLRVVEDPSSMPAPRPGLRRYGAHRLHPATEEADVFAVPPTDAPDVTAEYAANTARRIIGDGRKGSFTLEEEECIIRFHEIDQMSWDRIGYLVSNRTAYSVHSHYQKILGNPDCEARQRLLNQNMHVRPSMTSANPLEQYPDRTEPSSTHVSEPAAFTETEDELVARLRDHEGMTWAQISSYLSDRTSHASQTYYNKHSSKDGSSVPVPDLTSPALGNSIDQQIINAGSPLSVSMGEYLITRMSPPSVPAQLSSRSASASSPAVVRPSPQKLGGVSFGDPQDDAQLPQTPSVHVRQTSVPPKHLEVGPSAWNITQPASKGPLPFQPARKGLAPIRPKSSTRGIYDPFISRAAPTTFATSPSNQTGYGNTTVAQSVHTALSRSTKPSAGNPTIGMDDLINDLPQAAQDRSQPIDTLSTPDPQFTPEQDTFIRKARENRNWTWAAIAEALPGNLQYPASAITHRYYDVLLGRKFAPTIKESQDDQTSGADKNCHVRESSSQTTQYIEQGPLSTDKMPCRISNSTRDQSTDAYHEHLAPNQARWSKPLLRQALKNLTRRKSSAAEIDMHLEDITQELPRLSGSTTQDAHTSRAPRELDQHSRGTASGALFSSPGCGSVYATTHDDRSHLFDGGDEHMSFVISDVDDGEYALPGAENELPGYTTTTLGPSEEHPHSHPEVVIQSGECDNLNNIEYCHVSPEYGTKRNIPATAATASHDTVHIYVSSKLYKIKTAELGGTNSVSSSGDACADDESHDSLPETHPDDLPLRKQISVVGTKHKRRPRRVNILEIADSGSGTPRGSHPDSKTHDAAHTTPVRRVRGRPRKSSLVSGSASRSNKLPVPNREQNGNAQDPHYAPTPERSAQQETPASSVPRKTRNNGVKSVQKIPARVVYGTWTIPTAATNPASLSHELTDHLDDNQDEREVTLQNWEEALVAAFRSQPGAVLHCKDITAWVKEHNDYYRHTKDSWTHHVYNETLRNPAFQRVVAGQRASGYILVEANIRPISAGRADCVAEVESNVESNVDSTSKQGPEDVGGLESNAQNEELISDPQMDASPSLQPSPNTTEENNTGNDKHTGYLSMAVPPSHQSAEASVIGNADVPRDEAADASPTFWPADPPLRATDIDNTENDGLPGDQAADVSPALQPAETSVNVTEVDNSEIDELVEVLAPLKPAGPSINPTEINTIRFDPPVKQEPAPESRLLTPFACHSNKRPQNAQHATPSPKRICYSNTALAKKVSALATPACSGNSFLNLLSQSARSHRVNSLSLASARASPALHVEPSGRRIVIATKVAKDDGNEMDELS
jgi:hypothetical protein